MVFFLTSVEHVSDKLGLVFNSRVIVSNHFVLDKFYSGGVNFYKEILQRGEQ